MQYETIVSQGHTRPSTSFGAPALIWHVGIWPRRTVVATDARCDPHDTAGLDHITAKEEFDRRREAWIKDIDHVIEKLEKKGRLRHDPARGGRPKRFLPSAGASLVDAGSRGLTLWWIDPGVPDEQRLDAAIRVRMHVDLAPDYVTYCFYMDIGQLWNSGAIAGERRTRLLQAVDVVASVCSADIASTPDAPTPPADLSPEEDAALLGARNLLYVRIWEEFTREMECGLAELSGKRGEVFANFRGLVMPVGTRLQGAEQSPAAGLLAKFSKDPKFDADGPEANAVIKAVWPFVRRVTPGADFREFVACGVMNWRALYITALGASSQWDPGEERPVAISDKIERDIGVREEEVTGEVPADLDDDRCVWKRMGRDGFNHPVRYLLLTKGTPNPRQIGRIVERINAMGTMRLYALKDWDVLAAADTHLRVLGQHLDKITKDWGDKRYLIEQLKRIEEFRWAQGQAKFASIWPYLGKVYVPGVIRRNLRRLRVVVLSVFTPWEVQKLLRKDEDDIVNDTKYSLLYEVSSELETELIGLGAALDDIGRDTIGGLHFRVARSEYHAKEFHRLLSTLNVGNIPTWISYSQFVKRGLAPAFDYISSVGTRVRALRSRLRTVSETIETSALVGQSAATRHNTAVLRQAITIMVGVLAAYLSKFAFPSVWSRAWEAMVEHTDRWGIAAADIVQGFFARFGWVGAAGVVAVVALLLWVYEAASNWRKQNRENRIAPKAKQGTAR